MIDWADWYVAIKMLWYDFDLMGLEYRFISYYSHGLIVVGVVYRKYWISFVNWWSYLGISYLWFMKRRMLWKIPDRVPIRAARGQKSTSIVGNSNFSVLVWGIVDKVQPNQLWSREKTIQVFQYEGQAVSKTAKNVISFGVWRPDCEDRSTYVRGLSTSLNRIHDDSRFSLLNLWVVPLFFYLTGGS